MELAGIFRELYRLRRFVAVGAAIALFASLSTVYNVSLLPPSLHSKSLDVGAASTRVLIDTPRSKIVDLGSETTDFTTLATRANLLANLMTSAPVKTAVAREAGVPARLVVADAPIIANVPRAGTDPGSEQRANDVVAESNLHRLKLIPNPELPIISIYAQGPTAKAAGELANGSVRALKRYLKTVAAQQSIKDADQLVVTQLGVATGGTVNENVDITLALMVFVAVLTLICLLILVAGSVVRGWREIESVEQQQSGLSAIDDTDLSSLPFDGRLASEPVSRGRAGRR